MMKAKMIAAAGAVALAASLFAAPGGKEPVAEGYPDWSGVTAKNFLYGRTITPSDLRQRTVVYVVVDEEAFAGQMKDLSSLVAIAALPASHATTWEVTELPREHIVVFSVRNVRKGVDAKSFAKTFQAPKDADEAASAPYRSYSQNLPPFYKDLALVGEEELTKDKLPYVAVFDALGATPAFTRANYAGAMLKDVKAAVTSADEKLDAEWTAPLGVREPKHFKSVQAMVAKGKPAAAALKTLASGMKSKDPETAKEAQVMYDALNQYASDLKLRISLEYKAAPARAYYDMQQLIKLFPKEKKRLAAVDAQLKQNKDVGSLGKIFEKLMLWGGDSFVPKNETEAKKIVAELQNYKKILEKLAESSNAQIQGEAALFSSQLDTLIDTIPTKVPQK